MLGNNELMKQDIRQEPNKDTGSRSLGRINKGIIQQRPTVGHPVITRFGIRRLSSIKMVESRSVYRQPEMMRCSSLRRRTRNGGNTTTSPPPVPGVCHIRGSGGLTRPPVVCRRRLLLATALTTGWLLPQSTSLDLVFIPGKCNHAILIIASSC